MLNKLVLKNISKSFRDYGIYFLTLVLGVSIFYMFNSIYAQQALMEITEAKRWYIESIQEMLSYLSVVVAVILGFLIVYANNFFIKQRKKELGIYMTLGMTKGTVSKVILLETSLMALAALGVGLVVGILGSQAMSVFTAKLFEAELTQYKFIFSLDGTIKTMIFFGIISLIVILFNTVAIGRLNLIDLIYARRKNETLRIKNIITSVIIFFISLICLGTAYYLIIDNAFLRINQQFFLSIVLGTIGTILFFLSLSGFLIKVVQLKKNLYYKGLNMFVLRQLNSKINTNFLSISVVCITLLLSIGILSSGNALQQMVSQDSSGVMNFDFSVSQHIDQTNLKEEGAIYSRFSDEVRAREDIDFTETLNYISTLNYGDFDLEFEKDEYFHETVLTFISLSDYNEERELQGLDPIVLDDKYIFVTDSRRMNEFAEQFVEKNISINIADWSLSPVEEIDRTTQVGAYFETVIAVPDEVVAGMMPIESVMKINFRNKEAESFYTDLFSKFQGGIYYVSRSNLVASAVGVKAQILFFAIYLGIVFLISCAAILAIQQLSEATDNKERYALLRKLGAEKKMINKALFIQILCYFMFPLGLAIVHSYFGLTAVNRLFTQELMRQDIISSSLITSTFIIAIYGIYFAFTYVGSKNIINKR